MAYYSCKGHVVYFNFYKSHIGLYFPQIIIEEHKKEVAKYHSSKATLRFLLDKKLPISLIKRLVKAAVKKNEKKGEFKKLVKGHEKLLMAIGEL